MRRDGGLDTYLDDKFFVASSDSSVSKVQQTIFPESTASSLQVNKLSFEQEI
jgi:hypothetical protein